MENAQPQQNVFYFDFIDRDNQISQIKLNSVFDSGNLREAASPSPGTVTIFY